MSNTFSNTMSALKIATFAKATESIELKPVQSSAQSKPKDAAVEEEEEVWDCGSDNDAYTNELPQWDDMQVAERVLNVLQMCCQSDNIYCSLCFN